jgi:hypothetical protein
MRKPSALLGLLAISAISAVGAAPAAQAGYYDYPVCMKVYGDPTYDECAFTTMAQCAATASGRSAQCFVSPFVASAAVEPQGRRHQRRYGAY